MTLIEDRSEIQISDGEPPTLHFMGKIIGLKSETLKKEMEKLSQSNPKGFSLDLSEVSLLDSSALGVIMLIAQRLRPSGGKLVLLNPQPNVLHVFQVTRLDTVLEIKNEMPE